MDSIDYYIQILSNGFLSETNIPHAYLLIPDIMNTLKKYNWTIIPNIDTGWATVKRVRTFSN